MLKKQFIVDLIIVIIILSFLEFFSYNSPAASSLNKKVLNGIGMLLMLVSITGLLLKKGIQKQPLDKLVIAFVFSMFLSTVTANLYWDQTFLNSVNAYKNYYVYFLYIIFVLVDISAERIERIILLLFFLSLLIFFVDFITFPNNLFSYRNEERRNGITIWFYGQGFTFLGAFYFLNHFFYKKNIFSLLFFVVAAYCLFLLTQSRMNLLALALGFLLLLIFSDLKKKYLITFFIVIIGAFFYFSSGIFSGVKEASDDQANFYKEDIRVLAHTYFLTEFQGGMPTQLFGNGFPSTNSNSNLSIEGIKGNVRGFWTADVGLTGIFSYFGLFGVSIWLLFFYSVFKMKNKQQSIYLKAYFLTLLTTAVTGYSIFDPGYMPATILALYLVRCEMSKEVEIEF